MNKRVNKMIITFIVICTFLLTFVCGGHRESKSAQFIYTIQDINNKTSQYKINESMDNYYTNYYQLIPPGKGEIGDCTVYGYNIYYIHQVLKDQSNVAEVSRIYKYNIENDETTLIYEEKDPAITWINELRAKDNKVYWSSLKDNKFTLKSLDITSSKINDIYTVEDQPIVLGGDMNYLSWYEGDD